jgi:hypothetical protein
MEAGAYWAANKNCFARAPKARHDDQSPTGKPRALPPHRRKRFRRVGGLADARFRAHPPLLDAWFCPLKNLPVIELPRSVIFSGVSGRWRHPVDFRGAANVSAICRAGIEPQYAAMPPC